MTEQQRFQILTALTKYDQRQSTKKSYNPYALAHYCAGIERIKKHCDNGADLRLAILNCFIGKLCDLVLKSVSLDLMTIEECKYSEFKKLPDCYRCDDSGEIDGADCPDCNN